MYKQTFRIDEDGAKIVPAGLKESIARQEEPRPSGKGREADRKKAAKARRKQTKARLKELKNPPPEPKPGAKSKAKSETRPKGKTGSKSAPGAEPKLEDTISFRVVADNSPKDRRKARRKRRSRAFLIFVIIIVVIAAVAYFGFPLQNVDISGNRFYGDDIVRTWILSDQHSDNALYVVLNHKFGRKAEIPFIDSVDIKMTGRTSIEIEVYEKPVIGCAYIGARSSYAYFDKDGIVSEMSAARMENVPVVEGLGVSDAQLYEPIEIANPEILRDLLELAVNLQQYELVPEIVEVDGDRMTLDYGDVSVVLGSSDFLSEKVIRLSYIMPIIGDKDWNGTLHLENWTYENTDVVFKKE